MNKAIAWAKDFWHGLPQWVQAGAVIFAGGGIAALGKLTADFSTFCFQLGCLKHYLGVFVGAGAASLRFFYMRPGPGKPAGYQGS